MEKRSFYRLKHNLTCDFVKLNPQTIEVISNPIIATIEDLSGGGVSFITDEELTIDQLLEIKINYQGSLIIVLGKVRRKEEKDQIFVYGIEFVYLDQKTQDKLIRLIFDIQRKTRI